MMTKSPVASWMPRRRAAPLPILCGCRKTRICGCCFASSARISREPSLEPSSTQSSSMSSGYGENFRDHLAQRGALVVDRHHDRELHSEIVTLRLEIVTMRADAAQRYSRHR